MTLGRYLKICLYTSEWLQWEKTGNISITEDSSFSTCFYAIFLIMLHVYEKIKMQINSQMVIDICKSLDICYTSNGSKIISFENINRRLKISVMYIL